jgi:hypothetical protein
VEGGYGGSDIEDCSFQIADFKTGQSTINKSERCNRQSALDLSEIGSRQAAIVLQSEICNLQRRFAL